MTAVEAAPRTVGLRGSAWVALAVFTKAVRVNSAPVTQPLASGQGQNRQGIFGARAPTVEERLGVEVVAVGTEADCRQAVEAHRAANGDLGAEYTVTEHRIGLPSEAAAPPEPVAAACIGCGTPLADGTSFCQPCRERQWSAGWRPDTKDEEA